MWFQREVVTPHNQENAFIFGLKQHGSWAEVEHAKTDLYQIEFSDLISFNRPLKSQRFINIDLVQ